MLFNDCLFQVGGAEEYEVCEAIQSGRIKKPVIAFCIGTCTDLYKQEVI